MKSKEKIQDLSTLDFPDEQSLFMHDADLKNLPKEEEGVDDQGSKEDEHDAFYKISAKFDKLVADQNEFLIKDREDLAERVERSEKFSKKIEGPKEGKGKFAVFGSFGSASVMGLHMVSGPIAGGGVGYLIDKFFHTEPYGIVIGLFVGIAAGFYNVWLDAKKMMREQGENSESSQKDI